MVKTFDEFLEEELNFSISQIGEIELTDRWFYYDSDDEIIYGCDDEPVHVKDTLFYFNPKMCKIYVDGKENSYDINQPLCLISYDMDKNKLELFSDNTMEYLKTLGYKCSSDVFTDKNRNQIENIFDEYSEKRMILLYGNKVIASTFDIIEEN